ncbi:MAG: hypothetical protein IIC11_08105 [Proteobacteria bacterium]|nr:hypothetical protein [Pseudomonadota bacterium]
MYENGACIMDGRYAASAWMHLHASWMGGMPQVHGCTGAAMPWMTLCREVQGSTRTAHASWMGDTMDGLML